MHEYNEHIRIAVLGLESPDGNVKNEAIHTLSWHSRHAIGGHSDLLAAIPGLVTILKETKFSGAFNFSTTMHHHAAIAIGDIAAVNKGAPELQMAVQSLLESARHYRENRSGVTGYEMDTDLWGDMAYALGQIGTIESLPELLEYFRGNYHPGLTTNSKVRNISIDAVDSVINRNHGAEGLSQVADVFLRMAYANEGGRAEALILRKIMTKEQFEGLLHAAERRHGDEWEGALRWLGMLGDARAIPVLCKILGDETSHPLTRGTAASSLLDIFEADKEGALDRTEVLRLCMKSYEITSYAGELLAILGPSKEQIRQIVTVFESGENDSIRGHAAWVLANIPDKEVQEVLYRNLGVAQENAPRTDFVHCMCASATKLMGTLDAVERKELNLLLLEQMRSEKGVHGALCLLRQIGDESVIYDLIDFIDTHESLKGEVHYPRNRNSDIALTAIEYIARRGDHNTAELIKQLLEERSGKENEKVKTLGWWIIERLSKIVAEKMDHNPSQTSQRRIVKEDSARSTPARSPLKQ